MLRCSICSRIYQNGTQQFCTNDGGKLLRIEIARRPFKRITLTKLLPFTSDLATTKLQPLNESIDNAFEASPTTPLELPKNWQKEQEWNIISAGDTLENAVRQNENKFIEHSLTSSLASPQVSYRRNGRSNLQSKRSLIAASLFAALLVMIGVTFVGAYFLREQKLLEKGNSVLAATTGDFDDETVNYNRESSSTGFIKFHNLKKNSLPGADNDFVKFSIVYPNHWQKNSDKSLLAVSNNFLNLTNVNHDKSPIEQIAIGSYESRGTFGADGENFPALATNLSAEYSQRISAYKHVFEDFTTFNSRGAYEFRFEGEINDQNQKTIQIWGRTIFLPAEKETAGSGLTITILSTPLVPDLSDVKDVGEKSESLQILKTLQLEN